MTTKKWKLLPLLTLWIFMILGAYSLFWNEAKFFWRPLDASVFRFLNSWIQSNPFWQNFWAMANHPLADWLEDVLFLLFFIWIIKETPRTKRQTKIAECTFILLYAVMTHLMANELLFRGFLHIKRMSPTLVLDSFTNLSDFVTWLKVKTKSPKSFPGDHGTTALLSLIGFLYLTRDNFKIAIVTSSYAIFLLLPRMIVGAHWFTDIFFGSGLIAFLSFSLAFFTPLASSSIQAIERGFRKLSRKPRIESNEILN